jgi:hypothetical protein
MFATPMRAELDLAPIGREQIARMVGKGSETHQERALRAPTEEKKESPGLPRE